MKVTSEREVGQSCPTLHDPWTAADQAPLSMGFSRQEYWSGVPLPSPKYVLSICICRGFTGGSYGKESACNEFSPWVGKIPLEKGMATHSSILAWRNPWTDELGGLQSMGLQRIGLSDQCFHFYDNLVSSLWKIRRTVFHRGCTIYLAKRLQFFHIFTNTCNFLFLRFTTILV